MQDNLFSAGELARMAGVSLRTIRFYDIKGLLCPVAYSESGYRLYNQQSFAILQHILMLKYLGFSLQQISDVIANKEDINEHSVKREIQDNDLLVDDVEAIYNYVHSYSGNAPYILERHQAAFRQMLKERMEYGGNTVLFLSALDERIALSCASGSACTYEN